jgi:hypothetical protein
MTFVVSPNRTSCRLWISGAWSSSWPDERNRSERGRQNGMPATEVDHVVASSNHPSTSSRHLPTNALHCVRQQGMIGAGGLACN